MRPIQVLMQSASGRAVTRTVTATTDQRACAKALRELEREEPGQLWRAVRAL